MNVGGHLEALARLPGLAEWIRVRDWRIGQIHKLANVSVHFGSTMFRSVCPARILDFLPAFSWGFRAEFGQ